MDKNGETGLYEVEIRYVWHYICAGGKRGWVGEAIADDGKEAGETWPG